MFKKLFNEHTYPYWGLAASFIIILGCIITALLYPLGGGEHYSLLNYFISELGDLNTSYGHVVFNTCLVIGGLAFLPFMIGLGLQFKSKLAKIALFWGVIAALGAIGVGLVPMNYLTYHLDAANTFFFGGLFAIALFSISTIREKQFKFHWAVPLTGILVTIVFIVYVTTSIIVFYGLTNQQIYALFVPRPAINIAAIEEWAVLIAVLIWVIVAALFWLQYLKKNPTPANNP